MKEDTKRIKNLDIARAFAIICVLLCHSVEYIYLFTLNSWIGSSLNSQIYRTVLFTIGRCGVPLFLFLTGFFILSKKIETDEDVNRFYKKSILPLLITTELWIIIYNIFIAIYNETGFQFKTLVKNMLFMSQVSLKNMWYMPMILGIYLVIPFLNKIINTFSTKSLKTPIIFTFIISFILPTINIILKVCNIKTTLSTILDITFLGGIYGLYIIFGDIVRKGKLKKFNTKIIILIGLIFFSLACLLQIISYNNNIAYNIWYNSAFLFIFSVCLFELFTRIDTNKISNKIINMCTYISKISLALFFIHIIVQKILMIYIPKIDISNSIKTIILFVASLGISVLIIFIGSKIKIIKNKLFLIKD